MPATSYKVWTWGPQVGIGVTGASRMAVAGIAKKATVNEPYIVANEIFCNSIARVLLLPCPPGATLDKEGEAYFFSLDFNLAGQALPPASASAIVALDPRLAWGIILFDILIMNGDRHGMNISHDTTTQKVQIFDHSHAFLRPQGSITATLATNDGNICIGRHCLAAEINTIDGLETWIDRISKIPDYFIDGLIEATSTIGLPNAHKNECADFMKKRRSNILDIIGKNRAAFPKLPAIT
jgi:hypothetical protein